MSYKEKLKHPKWQKKRLEILNRDNWKCTKCGNTETTLAVHHKQYKKGCDPWQYDNDDLITLCEVCHKIIHEPIVQKKVYIAGKIPCIGRENIFSLRRKDSLLCVSDWERENLNFGHNNEFEYVGPFYTKHQHVLPLDDSKHFISTYIHEDDYCHDDGNEIDDGCIDGKTATFNRCVNQIKSCDIFLAIIKHGTNPSGTLVEIGIASQAKCKVIIITDSNDYWFANECGNTVYQVDDIDKFTKENKLKILNTF